MIGILHMAHLKSTAPQNHTAFLIHLRRTGNLRKVKELVQEDPSQELQRAVLVARAGL